MHLRPPSAADCDDRCGSDKQCQRCDFHQRLEAPLTAHDRRMHERFEQRLAALKRGEIPA